ncbi:hypothetical protein MCOR27_002285 [Pyricularia oryzae]|uniref:Hydrophobin n=4 Tax=Pyricularia TaxID=48558 RepID=A0ABQ8NX36_PYRGI|nr:hypothetical protein OOU_Y34scaffold01083g2 [Pyricularia oryzae Y34]KAH9427850.1 hypothetical protein MCOR02_011349 [Pyricularia oryzae]KAI6303411.1 hypothetical protein MCOR33_001498 [Pyricularia grisea]KAI6285367.1 hypothetical protein MCOR27_002285 [Pyricularia oryzae]KAI6308162.1 hypothetical protein MCOR30_011547 [Pyricularia oryzae]
MRSSLITLLLAPVAVLSLTTIVGENTTGPQCCDKGTPDPSKHCSSIGLNAYCCSTNRNDEGGGCDVVDIFKLGRTVKGFAARSTCSRVNEVGDTLVGFVGCAE